MIRSRLWTLVLAMFVVAVCSPLCRAEKKKLPAVRWTANAPGCEFSRDEDGRYRWRMIGDDLDLTLMVDSQELAKSRRRFYHVFGLYMSVTYNGQNKFEFPADLRLTFLRHRNVTEGYMDPSEFQNKLQNDLDTYIFDTERQIKKHPEQVEEKTARLREYQKEASEFIEFLSRESLQEATLTPGNPTSQGWVFYSTSNKWIGPWKPREDFLLFVVTKDRIWEFPFSVPAGQGDVILKKRDE